MTRSLSPIPFSFPEAAHPLVSTKNRDLWDNLGTKLPMGGFNFRSVRRVIVSYSQPIKNWFMLSVCISSYGCTREVWRARKKTSDSSNSSDNNLGDNNLGNNNSGDNNLDDKTYLISD